jgi:hypothetical protein
MESSFMSAGSTPFTIEETLHVYHTVMWLVVCMFIGFILNRLIPGRKNDRD